MSVSTTVEVEADSVEQARDDFYNSPDMPGSITHGAFGGSASVDESGEWEPVVIYDEAGAMVWEDRT